jgi:hypothetical protein
MLRPVTAAVNGARTAHSYDVRRGRGSERRALADTPQACCSFFTSGLCSMLWLTRISTTESSMSMTASTCEYDWLSLRRHVE